MNRTTYLFCLLFFAVFHTPSLAQKQNNQWRFGNGGGINFNTVPPSNVSGVPITTAEGSASVADKNTGNLLFYTNGVTVWDANDQIMPNGTGLLGGSQALLSSTTAAVIIPKPGSSTLFYLVTIDEQSSSNGVRYSVVDMSLNGGLGDIVAGQKNLFLYQTTSEKLEVVPASDGASYWLVTHDEPGNSFVSFKINSAGIQSTPVISSIGGTQGNGAGHMKINRQFNKIALGNFFSSDIELFDFDNTTGVVSNAVIWDFVYPNSLIYGLEFSPNGKFLYVSNLEKLVQYDISQSNVSAIQNSAFEISSGVYQAASLQLAVDKKIYINAGSVDVINCPNKPGVDCGFQRNAILNQSGGGGYGLPKWVYYANEPAVVTTNAILSADSCFGNVTRFSLADTVGVSQVNWLFGDVGSGVNNTATGFRVGHTFSQVGTYNVRAILIKTCGSDTLFFNPLQIIACNTSSGLTGIKLSGDTCNVAASISLQAIGTSSSPYFFWNFGDTASGTNDTITIVGTSASAFPTHTFSAPGVYNVCVSFQEPGFPVSTVCRTITIGLCCNAIIVANDSCARSNIAFSFLTGATISSISWNFDDPSSGINNSATSLSPTHVFSTTDRYNVTANIFATCGSFQVVYPLQIIECTTNCTGIIQSKDSCQSKQVYFQVLSTNAINSIEWNFGDPASGTSNISTSLTPTHLFSSTGKYKIRAIVNYVCGIDTAYKDLTIIQCDSIKQACTFYIPNAFSPNNDGVNDAFFAKTNCTFVDYECSIFNRWGQLMYKTSNPSARWDGKYKGADCPVGVYYYLIEYRFSSQKTKKVNGIVTLLR